MVPDMNELADEALEGSGSDAGSKGDLWQSRAAGIEAFAVESSRSEEDALLQGCIKSWNWVRSNMTNELETA